MLQKDSLAVGQERFWEEKEAEKENARRARSWRYKSTDRELTTWTPYGNPGPGYLAKVVRWNPRAKSAVFNWNRRRQNYSGYWSRTKGKPGDPMPCALTVPEAQLFNVSAYKPGDYRQFFVDPRTRAQYLKWAPMLLVAEEYYAGNFKVGPKEE